MRLAERTGDEVAAAAAFAVASERGWRTVTEAFTAHRPEVAARLAELSEYEAQLPEHMTAADRAMERLASPFFVPKPPEAQRVRALDAGDGYGGARQGEAW